MSTRGYPEMLQMEKLGDRLLTIFLSMVSHVLEDIIIYLTTEIYIWFDSPVIVIFIQKRVSKEIATLESVGKFQLAGRGHWKFKYFFFSFKLNRCVPAHVPITFTSAVRNTGSGHSLTGFSGKRLIDERRVAPHL
jgi:hypothetical protein